MQWCGPARLTLQRIHGALGRVDVLDVLPLVAIPRAGAISRRPFALVRVKRPPILRVFVLEHARWKAAGGRRQLAAAELGHGALAARADDEDLLLAPFAGLPRHRDESDADCRCVDIDGCPGAKLL